MDMSKNRKGFSLIEILISVILVGLAITALVAANNSFTMANGAGADLSTAEFLIEQIRELTTLLPVMDPALTPATWTTLGPAGSETSLDMYNDVDDFDGFTSSSLAGPIDANRNVLSALSSFTQSVTVERVSQTDFNTVVADSDPDPFVRVTVSITQNGQEISSASWIRASY